MITAFLLNNFRGMRLSANPYFHLIKKFKKFIKTLLIFTCPGYNMIAFGFGIVL